MIGDILSGIFEVFGRVVTRIVVDILFEFIIQGTGAIILRLVFFWRPTHKLPGDFACGVVGLLFWVFVCSAGFCFLGDLCS